MEGFRVNREGFLVSETRRQCTNCRCIFEKKNETVTLCSECNSARVKSMSAEYKMLARAKSRAKERGIDINITIEDIVIPNSCPVLGIPLVVHKGKSGTNWDSPSLDKIDPEKGYVKGNIMIISSLANSMKYNASKEYLLKFAEWVIKTYKTAED